MTPQPGDIVRDANNDLWWRSWDNAAWVFLLRHPGRWVSRATPGDEPMEPLRLLIRDLKPAVTTPA